MHLPAPWRLVACVLGTAGALACAGPVPAAVAPPRLAPAPDLVEGAGCGAAGHQVASFAPSAGGATQRVTVRVRPTVIAHLDGSGRVVSVLTNTGCAPRRDDDFYVEQHGELSLASAPVVEKVLAVRYRGDWRVPAVHPVSG